MRFTCAAALVAVCCQLLLLLTPVHAKSSTYTAAAIQFTTLGNYTLPAWQTVQLNIDAYESWVARAAKAGADVVIFPEGGLGMFNARQSHNHDRCDPCDGSSMTSLAPSVS